MNSRAVQEPEAWFACNGGYFEDTQDTDGGLVITFRAHTGLSGYLFRTRTTISTVFNLRIEETEGAAKLIATCYGAAANTYSVTLDEWHTVIWAPMNNIFKIDEVDQGFSGSVQNIKAVPLRFCSGATEIDIATISKWDTYTDDEAAYNRNFLPQSDGRYYDTVNSQYFSFTGSAPDYYTPDPGPDPGPDTGDTGTTGWLTFSPSAGTGTTQITLTAPEYTDIVQRTASLRIEGANGSVVYLTAAQEKYDPPFVVRPSSLDFVWAGETLTLQVTSDVGWNTSYPDWITLKPRISVDEETTVQVTATANPGDTIRSGAIVFMNVDSTPIGTVSITQAMNNVEGDTIIYTTTDGNTIENPEIDNLIGNYYNEGHGYLVFDGAAKEIPASAFNGYKTLETITFVDGTSLGDSALRDCTALKSVNFSAVTAIANSICSGCTQLQGDIDLSNIVDIGSEAFRICESITSVTIGSACTNIQDYAFYGCKGLESITSEAITAPAIDGRTTFNGIKRGGTLVNPEGSDYSSWFATNNYNLGHYGWNAPEFSPSELDFSTQSSQTLTLYTKGSSGWTLSLPDWITADPATGNSWSSYTVTLTAKKVYVDKSDGINITDDHYKGGAWGTRIGATTVASTDYPVPENYQIMYIGNKLDDDDVKNLNWTAHTFDEASALGVLEFSHPVDSLSPAAFAQFSNFNVLILPPSMTIINNQAAWNNYLNYIIFGGNERVIGMDAFAKIGLLKDYDLPETLVYIGPCAFSGNGNFQTVVDTIEFGPNIRMVEGAAFTKSFFDKVYFYGTEVPQCSYATDIDSVEYGPFDGMSYKEVHAPEGSDYSSLEVYGLDIEKITYDLTAKPPEEPSGLTVYPSISEINTEISVKYVKILVYSPSGAPQITIENPENNTVVSQVGLYVNVGNWYIYHAYRGNTGTATLRISDSSGSEKESTVTVFRKV